MAHTENKYLGRVYYIMHRPVNPPRKPGDLEKEFAKELCDTYNRAYTAGYAARMYSSQKKGK